MSVFYTLLLSFSWSVYTISAQTYGETSGTLEAIVNGLKTEIAELQRQDTLLQDELENISKQFVRETTLFKQRIQQVENVAGSQSTNREKRLILNGEQYPVPFVAFDAHLSQTLANQGTPEQTVVYDHVLTNIMDGYNSSTGVFTVPIKGVYFISWTTQLDYVTTLVTKLYVNSNVIAASQGDTRGFHGSTTKNTILDLNKGDRIYVTMVRQKGHILGQDTITSSFEATILYTV